MYDINEIVRSYRQADNKTEQVMILAQLTASDVDTIIEILKDAGAINPADIKKRICCRCGREYISANRKGVAVCEACQGIHKEISKIEYQIKRNNAKIAENNRRNGKIMETNKKMRQLLIRYKKSLDHIGIKKLPALPDEMKERLKKATKLDEKVIVLEDIEAYLTRQGLI